MTTQTTGLPSAIMRRARQSIVSYMIHLFLGIVYGLPAVTATEIFAPNYSGYVFLGVLAMVVMKTTESINEETPEGDFFNDEELTEKEVRLLLLLMMIGTIVGVTSVVLMAGLAAAGISAVTSPFIGILIAVSVPLADRQVGITFGKSIMGYAFLSVFVTYSNYRRIVDGSGFEKIDPNRKLGGPLF